MSDFYLELKSRIPVIAARTQIGRERLQTAQDAVGLSNERLARLVPVSEKTWRRWKEAGEVPTYALPQLAKVLRLELVEVASRTDPSPIDLAGPGLREEVAGGVAQLLDGNAEGLVLLRDLVARCERIEARLDELGERRPARRTRSGR